MRILFIVFILLNSHCYCEQPNAPDHVIDMEQRRGALTPPPQELNNVRLQEVTHFTDELLKQYRRWYQVANLSEMFGILCTVACPVLSGISASTRDSTLSTWAMGVGLVGVACVNFAHYAVKESAQRGMAANQMLRQEGLPLVPLLRNSTDDMSINSRRSIH